MAWTDPVFRYCERGADPSFWAEPANALSNAAFFIAAFAALAAIARQPASRSRIPETGLAILVVVIGAGSFVFHTFATRWAVLADVIPIGVFTLAYVVYALRVFLRASWLWVIAAVGAIAFGYHEIGTMGCPASLAALTAKGSAPCLNGTLMYAPAFVALVACAAMLGLTGHAAWRLVAAAAAVFFVSMVFRTLDFAVCDMVPVFGRPRGTHGLWHALNGLMLYLLLLAAIRHGTREREEEGAKPAFS